MFGGQQRQSNLFTQTVGNVFNKWLHIGWDVSLLNGLSAEFDIEKLFHHYHSLKSVKINPTFSRHRFISLDDPTLELLSVGLWNWCPANWHSGLLQHHGSKNCLRNIPKIKTSLNLVCVKGIKCLFISLIEEIAAVQIAMNDSKVLNVPNFFLVIFMKLHIRQDTMVNLVPVLYSLGNFLVLFFKQFRDLMKLSKEFSPSKYDVFVLHPFKLDKVKKLAFGPFKDHNDKLFICINEFVFRFKLRFRMTDVVKLVVGQEVDKEDLILNPLSAFVLRIRGDSDRELFLMTLRVDSGSFKGMIL